MMMLAEKSSGRAKRPRGRLGIGSGESEVINVIVPTTDMDRVRAIIEKVGLGATVAAWVRAAIHEKLERDTAGHD